jgi:hypothetical protein
MPTSTPLASAKLNAIRLIERRILVIARVNIYGYKSNCNGESNGEVERNVLTVTSVPSPFQDREMRRLLTGCSVNQ